MTMTEQPPLRKTSHERRVELGKQISEKIIQTFKEDVLAVLITGSTAKALDRPYSDLEMIAVVRDSREIPTKYYVHEGLLVQLDYKQESAFLKSARDPGFHDWPMSADESRNRIVLFERDEWTRRLVEAVEENDKSDFSTTLRFAALMMTESWAAVRNADLKNDSLDLRTRAFWMAWDTARVVYLLNRNTCSPPAGTGNNCSSALNNPKTSENSLISLPGSYHRSERNWSKRWRGCGRRL